MRTEWRQSATGLFAPARRTDPDFTTRIIKSGDTLAGIAFEVYKDAALWRVIADANRLDNPRRLEIGMPLSIPKMD